MRILFDTNVILDVMLNRKPFSRTATILLAEVERKKITGYICSTTVTTIYYLISKGFDHKRAREQITNLLKIFLVTPVSKEVLVSALNSKIKDYEDAVINESCLQSGVEAIVTRNEKDFKNSTLKILDPGELLQMIRLR